MQLEYLVQQWQQLGPAENENNLNAKLTHHMIGYLNCKFRSTPAIQGQSGYIMPDFALYNTSDSPTLVIETKGRVPVFQNAEESQFIHTVEHHGVYKSAIGTGVGNGIKQYLSVQVDPAKYGMVFNGDFFQLFKRSDGMIFPMTTIQRVTAESLPKIMKQLQHLLASPFEATTISVWNRKGGVAKTTNIINIAAILAQREKRVLVIDLDPQCDLTKGLGVDPNKEVGNFLNCIEACSLGDDRAYDIIRQSIRSCQFKITGTDSSCQIDVFPGERHTLEAFGETEMDPRKQNKERFEIADKPNMVKRMLRFVLNDYDYIFIDCSPKNDAMAVASLFAADLLLIPSDYDPETLRHVTDISTRVIHTVRKGRVQHQRRMSPYPISSPRILGLVFSNCPSLGVKMETKIDQALEHFNIKVYQTRLRQYNSVTLAKYQKLPVTCHLPKTQASKLYRELVDEVFFNPNFVLT